MTDTEAENLVARQRAFFDSGETRSVAFRKLALRKLKESILRNERDILDALHEDLGKSDFEAFATEIALVLEEIGTMLKKCGKWAKPERRFPGVFNVPGAARVLKDPHGVCLIMSPWNYPFQLSLLPLVGALAAGNTAIVKPSAYAPRTSSVIARVIGSAFPEEYVSVVEGGREENTNLLNQRLDYIFFTGSVAVGSLVMASAAKFLTPVTLELGGKSPCIVDETANIALSARRAVWGKCVNAGQTCVAPDYFLVHDSVCDAFVSAVREEIKRTYGEHPHRNPEFPKIVNDRHFNRLMALIDGAESANPRAKVLFGGRVNPDERKIEPTVILEVGWNDPVMQEEIFGPIIPIIRWRKEEEIVSRMLDFPRPLALYVFSRDKSRINRILSRVPFGGGCVNDVVMHVGTNTVPFGGTGSSGMGSYHGKESFETFSRKKSIIDKALWLDVPLRYAPFAGKYRKFRKFL